MLWNLCLWNMWNSIKFIQRPCIQCNFGGVVWIGSNPPLYKMTCELYTLEWWIFWLDTIFLMPDLFPPISSPYNFFFTWNTSNHLQERFLPQSFPCIVLRYWSIQQKLYEPAAIDKMLNTLKNQPWHIHQKALEVAGLMWKNGSFPSRWSWPRPSQASEFDIDDFSDYEDDTLGSPVPGKLMRPSCQFTVAVANLGGS